jgi:hypothetical protein
MKFRALKIFKILAVAVFMAGVVAAGLAYTVKRAQGEHPSVGFYMASTQVFTPAGGQPSLHATIERHQKSDGSFKSVTTYYKPDGTVRRVDTGFGQTGRGVFQVDEKKRSLNFISPMRDSAHVLTEAMMRQDPHVVRDETVSGYKTIVVRLPDSDGSGGYTELYGAPALQGEIIKSVSVSESGVTVIEPTKIVTGEPDAAVFAAVPAYPVNYDQFEEKIKSLEEAGNLKAAEEMRRRLQQLKSGGR